MILTSTHMGLPLSTTQVCTGSILGAGAGHRLAGVHWGVAGRIALSWGFTLPSAAVVGAAASWLAATGTTGVVIVAVTGIAVASGLYTASRRNAVTPDNVNDVAATLRRDRRPGRLTPERSPAVNIDWATLAADRGRRGRSRADRRPARLAWRSSGCPPAHRAGPARRTDGAGSGTRSAAGTATAVICVLAAGLVVCYGLFLIIA